SKWPDFMQEALVYRLLTRRNEIAKLYELGDLLDCREIAPPSFSIVLDNPRKVAELEKRYGLPAGALEHELGRDPLQFGRVETETVVHHGVVVPSRRSALIRTLTKYRYPSGLTERYQRQSDRHPPGI
ncbi:MAG: hypothetical protein P1U58_01575, partial [Verrucomicrobiales bacterium]|nr:hypothetical protein [Verrucomicrobiales bacterium]